MSKAVRGSHDKQRTFPEPFSPKRAQTVIKTQLTEDVEGHWHRATRDKQTSGEARTPSLTDDLANLGARADIGEVGNGGLSARDWESDEQRNKDGQGRD